jgi:hypothetical protein
MLLIVALVTHESRSALVFHSLHLIQSPGTALTELMATLIPYDWCPRVSPRFACASRQTRHVSIINHRHIHYPKLPRPCNRPLTIDVHWLRRMIRFLLLVRARCFGRGSGRLCLRSGRRVHGRRFAADNWPKGGAGVMLCSGWGAMPNICQPLQTRHLHVHSSHLFSILQMDPAPYRNEFDRKEERIWYVLQAHYPSA